MAPHSWGGGSFTILINVAKGPGLPETSSGAALNLRPVFLQVVNDEHIYAAFARLQTQANWDEALFRFTGLAEKWPAKIEASPFSFRSTTKRSLSCNRGRDHRNDGA